jgi:hypothetical protein
MDSGLLDTKNLKIYENPDSASLINTWFFQAGYDGDSGEWYGKGKPGQTACDSSHGQRYEEAPAGLSFLFSFFLPATSVCT